MSVTRRIIYRLTEGLSRTTGLNLNKPSIITAKMTMRCNSRCIHCNIWQQVDTEPELTTEQWFKTLDQMRRWLGCFTIVFTGGEAMLRPDMIAILTHAAGLGIDAGLLTNGLCVTDQLAEQIVGSGLNQVTLSFDGINAVTHDRFRGNPGFHAKTLAAISSLTSHRKRLNSSLKILLKTVISRNNIAELVDIAKFAQAEGVSVRFQPIEQNYAEPNDPQWYKDSELWVDDLPFFEAQTSMLKRMKAAGAPIENTTAELDIYLEYFRHPEDIMAAVKAHDINGWNESCRAALTNFVISSNGDVRMCFQMEPIGNVTRTAPKAIWANRALCWKKPCAFR